MAVQVTRTGVAFTVGIIILALAAFAGLYFVQQQGEQARRDDAIQVAEERLEAENDQEVSIDGATSDDSTTEEDAAENTPQAGNDAAVIPGTNDSANNSASATQDTATELPQTGPEMLGALIGLGALTYAGAVYVRSRRALV